MNRNPLVTVIVLSYKNYNYIYEAIESVLSQDYNNIELIISNDGSDDFDKNALEQFFKKNIRYNIKNIKINHNPKNLGTVKNINKAIELSAGDYIVMFAADDKIYDNKVISNFVNAFNSLPESELVITSQIGMYDVSLKKLIQPFISKEYKEKIINLPPKKIFSEMAVHCFIPGSGTVYKKEIFKKYGLFDEKYKLVEDYSSSLKLLRQGVKYNYFDFVSFKHRDGGVSHGNIKGDISIGKTYEKDILNIMDHEIWPHLKLLSTAQKKEFQKIYKTRSLDFALKYTFPNISLDNKIKYIAKYFDLIIQRLVSKILHSTFGKLNRNAVELSIVGIMLFSLYSTNLNYKNDFVSFTSNQRISIYASNFNRYIGILGLSLILTSLTTKTIKPILSIVKNHGK